ncbi:PQQ-binding-like beta-propeller repeat protein [Aquipuribacter nitratireducens]|uniref:PQQ-binding-like beta-propeller repeat protein n=1 Tax=Aquipuribacter nitratireducens TaxID=650104 RepID=A0ABW0GS83_9MICO
MPTIGGNLGNQNYSGLTQITKQNLKKLAPTWRTHVSDVAPASNDVGSQTHPIVVDGVIYMDTPSGGVIAVDGATGDSLWKWQPTDPSRLRRGVSVGEGMVFTMASGGRAGNDQNPDPNAPPGNDVQIFALDKDTGEEVWVSSPLSPQGDALGRDSAPGTRYHDGLVYIHTNNGDRGSVSALDASDGSIVWTFYGVPERGTVFTDVNGNTFEPAETWGPVLPNGTDCGQTGGATPWMHGAIDPELGMYYMTFGNPRSCNSSQDGSQRPGDNLFSSTMVAVDMKTGDYKWHYQSIPHDVWDMDNVHPLTLADVEIDGATRKVVFYGSKSGHQFVLDRTNGRPALPDVQKPMIIDSRQNSAETEPFPVQRQLPECLVWERLSPDNVPGDPWRAVPNYNGYQPDEDGKLLFNPDSYVKADEPFLTYPDGDPQRSGHRQGCMYDPHWDLPILSTTSQNGGGDFSANSYSHSTNMVYFPYGTNPVAHWRGASQNGHRATGQYQTGGILGYDASTGEVKWTNHWGLDMSHGQTPLTTASDLLFVGQNDGTFHALDAVDGKELWTFQTGSGIAGAPVTYMVDGEQYVAVFAAGHTNPYGNSVTRGDSLWAFKLNGEYTTESGSQEAPDTAPLTIRRPVSGAAVEGSTVDNTVLLARQNRTADTAAQRDSTSTAGMSPTHLRVPVGTTVTFRNPGTETFPNFPNLKEHCATQFFEGEFNARLQPGETYQHTFDRAGEYYFNDCTDPRPTGKIEVYLTPEDVPGALSFRPSTLDLGPGNGLFTGVNGRFTAVLDVPRGLEVDGDVVLRTPLSESPVTATRSWVAGGKIFAQFEKADVDNNVPEGRAVPLTVVATVLDGGEQRQLTSTTEVRIVK